MCQNFGVERSKRCVFGPGVQFYLEHHSETETDFRNTAQTGEAFSSNGQEEAQSYSDDTLEPGNKHRRIQTRVFQLPTQQSLVHENQQNGHRPAEEQEKSQFSFFFWVEIEGKLVREWGTNRRPPPEKCAGISSAENPSWLFPRFCPANREESFCVIVLPLGNTAIHTRFRSDSVRKAHRLRPQTAGAGAQMCVKKAAKSKDKATQSFD